MKTLGHIEAAILQLPEPELLTLRDWINERAETGRLSDEEPALETALLASLDSPVRDMDDAFFEDVRQFVTSRRPTGAI